VSDGVAVLGLDEGHVVHDEDVGLPDAGEVLARRLRRALAVAAPVEGPRAAERAVPRAAAGELDRRARVEHPDEVLVAPAPEIAGGQVTIQIVEQGRARAGAGEGHHAGQGVERRIADGLEPARGDHLALAAHDAVDGAARVLEELGGHERGAVAADEHECRAPLRLGVLGEIDHLGHVGEVVHGEADGLRGERLDLAPVVRVLEDLQIEEPHVVAGGPHGRGHALEAERLQSEVQRDFRAPPPVEVSSKSAPQRKNYPFPCNAYTTAVNRLTAL
jgi:hypothetical protein